MNASLREIVLAVRYGDASLVGESVGYLILGACDRAIAVPRSVDLDGVLVTGEGDVALDATPVSEDEAERSLRFLLGQLLTLLRTPFPNLARVAAREPCGLQHLVTELEAALVPVNRRAARRSLSRLVRETRRSLAKEHLHAAVVDIVPAPARSALPSPESPESPVPARAWPDAAQPEHAPREHALPEQAPREQAPREQAPREQALREQALFGQNAFEQALFGQAQPEAAPLESPVPAATHEDAAPHEAEQRDADPYQAAQPLQPAAWEVDIDWVDEVPSLFAGSVTQLPLGASFETPAPVSAQSFPDDFDEALTRVNTAVETLPPPEIQPRSAFNLRRLVTTAELEGPLLPSSASTEQSPSSIQDLLHRMRLEGEPTELVLADLARLARVDLSPLAPPVG